MMGRYQIDRGKTGGEGGGWMVMDLIWDVNEEMLKTEVGGDR